MLEILETPKSQADLTSIIQEVGTSPFIAQLSAGEIARYTLDKTIRYFYESGDLLGFAAWQDINAHWSEIGPLYIFPQFRAKGWITQFAKTVAEMNTGKKLFAVTKNPLVKRMLTKAGFRRVSLFALPRPILVHLIRHFTPSRMISLFRKRSTEPIGLYVTDWRYGQTDAESGVRSNR